jgi:hypothetical protein
LRTDSELLREIERLIERLRDTTCTVVMMLETARGNIFSSHHDLLEAFQMRSSFFVISAPREISGLPALQWKL